MLALAQDSSLFFPTTGRGHSNKGIRHETIVGDKKVITYTNNCGAEGCKGAAFGKDHHAGSGKNHDQYLAQAQFGDRVPAKPRAEKVEEQCPACHGEGRVFDFYISDLRACPLKCPTAKDFRGR